MPRLVSSSVRPKISRGESAAHCRFQVIPRAQLQTNNTMVSAPMIQQLHETERLRTFDMILGKARTLRREEEEEEEEVENSGTKEFATAPPESYWGGVPAPIRLICWLPLPGRTVKPALHVKCGRGRGGEGRSS